MVWKRGLQGRVATESRSHPPLTALVSFLLASGHVTCKVAQSRICLLVWLPEWREVSGPHVWPPLSRTTGWRGASASSPCTRLPSHLHGADPYFRF